MSDLYLVLRSRLASVPEWVFIESAVLRQARERRGYSYEAMGRLLSVSSKTYERYEKAGRVPPPLVPRLAEVLQLEIEEPPLVRVTTSRARDAATLDELERLLHAIDRKLDLLDPSSRLAAIEAQLAELSRAVAARA